MRKLASIRIWLRAHGSVPSMEIDIAARSRQWRQFRTRRFAASTLSHTRWNSPLPTEGDYDEVYHDGEAVIRCARCAELQLKPSSPFPDPRRDLTAWFGIRRRRPTWPLTRPNNLPRPIVPEGATAVLQHKACTPGRSDRRRLLILLASPVGADIRQETRPNLTKDMFAVLRVLRQRLQQPRGWSARPRARSAAGCRLQRSPIAVGCPR